MSLASETRTTSVPNSTGRMSQSDNVRASAASRPTNVAAAHCPAFLRSKLGWTVTFALVALAAYLLWTHTGHVVATLPFLLLLACPLMHLFGHQHGHHGHNQGSETSK